MNNYNDSANVMSNILGQSISVQLYIALVNPRPYIQTFLSFVSTLIMIIPVYKPNKFCVSRALFICLESTLIVHHQFECTSHLLVVIDEQEAAMKVMK